jgi:hypothetical protein
MVFLEEIHEVGMEEVTGPVPTEATVEEARTERLVTVAVTVEGAHMEIEDMVVVVTEVDMEEVVLTEEDMGIVWVDLEEVDMEIMEDLVIEED